MKKFIKKLAGVVAVVVCGTCMNACSCGEGKYIITLNSGVEGGNSSFEWVANKPFTKPEDPQRKGYVFDGWFADKELTVPYDFTSSVKGNITIFAKWIKCGQITLPEKSIGQNGYRVYLPEGEDNMLLIGESIEFILEISGNYLQDSNPVFKINGQELSYKEKLTEGFYEKYIYEYTCQGDDIDVTVEGIIKDNYDVILNNVEGARIKSLSGYNNLNVPKNTEYKFVVLADNGYDISGIVVKANGQILTSSGGIYTINNIVEDIQLEISQIKKQTYNVTYLENSQELNALVGENIKITRQAEKATFGSDYIFNVFITNSKYSQAIVELANHLRVYVDGQEIDGQYVSVNNGVVTISGEIVTGELEIDINSADFPADLLTLTIPNLIKDIHGYEFKILGCDPNGGNNFQAVESGVSQFTYGSKLKICLDIAEEYLELARKAGVSILTISTDSPNDIGKETYIEKNGTEEQYLTIQLRKNVTLKVKSEFSVGFDSVDGVNYIKNQGYDNKVYCFNDVEGVDAGVYKFGVDVNKDAYDTTLMSVQYYTDDINNAIEIVPQDGVYTVSNISSDIRIVAKNVTKKIFGFELPQELVGIESLTIKSQNNIDEVTYLDKVQLELKVADSHNKYIDNIMLSLGEKAEVEKISQEGNVITFELSKFKDTITASDFLVTGQIINSYVVSLPKLESRTNYILKDSQGREINNNFIFVNYGSNVEIQVVPVAEYSEDDDFEYTIKTKTSEKLYSSNNSFMINVANVKEDLEIMISGIDTKNTYVVNFYDYDGESLLESIQVTHGDNINLLDSGTLTIPEHYEFDSWYVAVDNSGVYEATETIFDGVGVSGNLNVIAVNKAITYKIKFDNVYTEENGLNITIEDLKDGYFDLSDIVFDRERYTFDKFVLGEDILKIGGEVVSAGTILDKLSADMLIKKNVDQSLSEDQKFDILITATWKITVGSGNYNCLTLTEAIQDASSTEIDTIEILGNLRNEPSTIYINKSVRIVGVGETKKIITLSTSGLENYGYQSLLYIEGPLGKKIDVYLENVAFNYNNSSLSNEYSAATIVAKNCNLTLENTNINSQANGIVFIGQKDNILTINNGTISISNHETTQRDYGFGIKLIGEGENVFADISEVKFNVNFDCDSYKAIHYESKNYKANIKLDKCTFGGESVVESPTAIVLSLDGEAELEILDCVVNEYNTCWATFIEDNFAVQVDNTTIEKYNHLTNDMQYVQNLLDENEANNKLNNCQIYINVYNDLSDILIHCIGVNELGDIFEFVDFSNVAQFVKYLPYKSRMNYIKSSDLVLSNVVEVSQNQIIDLNGANIEFNNTVTNNGSIINFKDFEVNNGLVNNGVISATNGYVYLYSDASNTYSIFINTMVVCEDCTLENGGNVQLAYLNNLGETINSADILLSRELIDEDNKTYTAGLLTNDGRFEITAEGILNCIDGVVNNSLINVYGEIGTGNILTNNSQAELNLLANSKITLFSENIINQGTINKGESVTIVDNSAGRLKMGTVNDYGVLGEYSVEEQGNYWLVYGTAQKVADDSAVAKLYPNGTGYYMSFTLYTGIQNANKDVNITINRIDGIDYSYKQKTSPDKTDNLGRIEIIIDLNVVDGIRKLFDVNIDIESLDSSINLSYDIANAIDLL